MSITCKSSPDFGKARGRFSRIIKCAKAAAVILCISHIHIPLEVRGQTVSPSYKVTLAWNVHSDPTVNAYRVHYGKVSGGYTASIAVGNVTQTTISGLTSGLTYYFVITARNTSGLESAYSNVVTFQPGKHATSIRTTATGQLVLKVKGLIGQRYNIEASQDLKSWTVISTVIIPDGGLLDFIDPQAALFRKRYYRTYKAP